MVFFRRGRKYRVKKDYDSPFSTTFRIGEKVTFKGRTYSHYDGASVLEFAGEDGASKEFWIYDRDDDRQPGDYFQPLGLF